MTADRARGALAVLQDADGKFICEVPCGYIVEQTASAHKPRRIQAQRRRRAMLHRRVALTVALLTVAALLAALMPWSGSGAADKPKDTTAGTLEEVHQPTAVLLPSSGTVAEYVPNAAEVEALAKLIYGEAGIVPSTTEQAAVVWCVLNRVDDPRFPDTVLEVIEAPYQFSGYDPEYPVKEEFALLAADVLTRYRKANGFAVLQYAADLRRGNLTTAQRLKSIGIAPTGQEMLVRSCTALASGSPAIWGTRRSLPTRWRVKTALPFARQTSHSQDRRAGSLGQGHAAAITTYRRKK